MFGIAVLIIFDLIKSRNKIIQSRLSPVLKDMQAQLCQLFPEICFIVISFQLQLFKVLFIKSIIFLINLEECYLFLRFHVLLTEKYKKSSKKLKKNITKRQQWFRIQSFFVGKLLLTSDYMFICFVHINAYKYLSIVLPIHVNAKFICINFQKCWDKLLKC